MHSAPLPSDATVVRGYDFSEGPDYSKILGAYWKSGFQVCAVGWPPSRVRGDLVGGRTSTRSCLCLGVYVPSGASV